MCPLRLITRSVAHRPGPDSVARRPVRWLVDRSAGSGPRRPGMGLPAGFGVGRPVGWVRWSVDRRPAGFGSVGRSAGRVRVCRPVRGPVRRPGSGLSAGFGVCRPVHRPAGPPPIRWFADRSGARFGGRPAGPVARPQTDRREWTHGPAGGTRRPFPAITGFRGPAPRPPVASRKCRARPEVSAGGAASTGSIAGDGHAAPGGGDRRPFLVTTWPGSGTPAGPVNRRCCRPGRGVGRGAARSRRG